MAIKLEICPGCGGRFKACAGPVHAYMTSSPACWAAFGGLLAAAYSGAVPMDIHRLCVDSYAAQHPGDGVDRRAIQSIGLHLARLYLYLEARPDPAKINQIMSGFTARKSSLVALKPPEKFTLTIADIAPSVGTNTHAKKVLQWAKATWTDWHDHHEYIKNWVEETG